MGSAAEAFYSGIVINEAKRRKELAG